MIDLLLIALWLSIALVNRAALLPLFVLLVDLVCYELFLSDFPRYCITSLCYLLAAQSNLPITLKIRYAFFAFAVLYWIGAIDNIFYNHIVTYEGVYYSVMPYAVITLNAYIAALMFTDGGRNIVGFFAAIRRIVNHCATRL